MQAGDRRVRLLAHNGWKGKVLPFRGGGNGEGACGKMISLVGDGGSTEVLTHLGHKSFASRTTGNVVVVCMKNAPSGRHCEHE